MGSLPSSVTRSRPPAAPGPEFNSDSLLLGLPYEIIFGIMALLGARDIEAAGASCNALYKAARDPALWKHLFDRDHAYCYENYPSDHPCVESPAHEDMWPDRLVPDSIDTQRLYSLLPPEEVDPLLPAPFARMRAMGKDMRWLYIAHSIIRPGDNGAGHSRSHPFTSHARGGTRATHQRWRGDPVCASSNGSYGCEFDYIPGYPYARVVAWRERGRHAGSNGYWSVEVILSGSVSPDGWEVVVHSAPTEDGRTYHYERNACYRSWFVTVDGELDGVRTAIYNDGMREDAVWHSGVWTYTARAFPDGTAWTSSPRGDLSYARVTYPNGDMLGVEYAPNRSPRPVRYCVSDSCPDKRLAGRTFCRVQWATQRVTLPESYAHLAVWTVGLSEDDILFRAYIVSGQMSWHPDVQAVAEQHVLASGLPY